MDWHAPPGGGLVVGVVLGLIFWAVIAGILFALGVL